MAKFLRWQVGDVRITRVQELEAPGMRFIIPNATIDNLAGIPWLTPSVRPIFDAGLVDLVDVDHVVHDVSPQ